MSASFQRRAPSLRPGTGAPAPASRLHQHRPPAREPPLETEADRDADAQANPLLFRSWQKIKDWNEKARYLQKTQVQAQGLFDAVTDPNNGVMQWIRAHW